MVRAADDLKGPLRGAVRRRHRRCNPTGASRAVERLQQGQPRRDDEVRDFSWPVTLAILVLAFGSLVAAGLPLLLTMAGLVASAGSLVLINHLDPVSIWAMNFAMMFALALGIDYALFIVVRFRGALCGRAALRRGGRRDDGHRRQGRPAVRRDRAGLPVRGDARARPAVPLDGRSASCSRSSSCSPRP